MELTGRLTANAVVSTLKDERQVVNFTLAINHYYKPKGAAETKQITQFVRCSYWISTAVAAKLLKGAVVEISGRIYATAYVDTDGKPKASLNVHCNHIKMHSMVTKKYVVDEQKFVAEIIHQPANGADVKTPENDIPF